MKKLIILIGSLGLIFTAWAQHGTDGTGDCSCPTCLEQQASGKKYTLPGLAGLEQEVAHDEHADHDHTGHDHAAHAGSDDHAEHDEHAGHDHAAHEGHDDHDDHAGHDHGDEAGGAIYLSPEIIQKVGLKLDTARAGSISTSVIFPAEIRLNRDRTAAISPRYSSVVREVFVEIGDEVKKGDLLASLENRATLAVYSVTAPLDGIIVTRFVSEGEAAGEDKVLFEIADLSTVWADISIFPRFLHSIRKGMPVDFIAHDGHTASGTIKFLSPLVSEETRTFTARCILTGADEDFSPGTFVRARITTGSASVRVRVERNAVQQVDGEWLMFVPSETGFESREVQVGIGESHFIEIVQGLEPGEEYVAQGSFSLKAEMITSGMDPHAGHGH